MSKKQKPTKDIDFFKHPLYEPYNELNEIKQSKWKRHYMRLLEDLIDTETQAEYRESQVFQEYRNKLEEERKGKK